MDTASALMTIAQLGLSLTGFAGLLMAFRFQDQWERVEIYALRFLFRSSIGAFVFALIPVPLLIAGTMTATFWSLCFATLGLWTLTMVVLAFLARYSGRLRPRFAFGYWGLTLSGLASGMLDLGAACNLYDLRQPALYMYGLYWLLVVATFQLMMQVMHSLRTIDAD